MATAMKTKNVNTKTEPVNTDNVTVEKESIKEEKKVEKVYSPTDGIPCKSITQGGLYMSGLKVFFTNGLMPVMLLKLNTRIYSLLFVLTMDILCALFL